jgi:dipeptidyl aminopeptidase/acylaminoacyl peptidase
MQIDLPILIIQTTKDIRVPLEEGYNFMRQLEENGNNFTYWEIENAEHCMKDVPDRLELIADWLDAY